MGLPILRPSRHTAAEPQQAPSQQHGFQNKKLCSSAINAGAVVTLLKVFFPCMTKDGKSCG